MKKFKNLDRLILTDCDGVCLDWEWAFNVWMQEHGFDAVWNVQGGIDAWSVEVDPAVPRY